MGWFRHGAVPAVDYQFLYILTGFADDNAARAALSDYLVGGSWGPAASPSLSVTGQPGFCVGIRTEAVDDELFATSNCLLEIKKTNGAVYRSKVNNRLLSTMNITPTPEGFPINSERLPNGLMFARPVYADDAWPYMRCDSETVLHHNNAALSAILVAQAAEAAFGVNGGASGGSAYSIPVWTAEPDTPIVDWTAWGTPYAPTSTHNTYLNTICNDTPTPDNAEYAGGTDQEIGFYDPISDTVTEQWLAREKVGGGWEARRGGRELACLSADAIYTWPYGVAAAGVPMIPTQPLVDEVLYQEFIEHVVALTVIRASSFHCFSWPANRTDGATDTKTTPNQMVEGMLVRLNPSVDVPSLNLHPLAEKIAIAWQRYGARINDRGGSLGLRIENEKPRTVNGLTNRWIDIFNGTPFFEIFDETFPWDEMQFLPANWGQPTWQPGRLEGLAWWIRTYNSNWMSTGGNFNDPVTDLWDQSFCSVELSSPGPNHPTYFSSAWPTTTRSAPRFSRANDTMFTTGNAKNLLLAASQETLGVSVTIRPSTAIVADARILSFVADGQSSDTDNAASFCIKVNAAGTDFECVRNSVSIPLGTAAINTDYRLGVSWDGTNATPYINGVAGTPVASTGTFGETGDITLGNVAAGGQGWSGAMCEAFICASDDMAAQITDFNSYSTGLWGV